MRLFSLAFLLLLAACTAPPSAPPNVLFILTDDQGYGDVHLHGNDSIDTPVLDALAASGARLDQFYVSPVCAPTRASLLTGRNYVRTGAFWVTRGTENMRPEELTLAEAFKANGYQTGIFGKWHNGAHYPYNPLGQGFDEFVGFSSGHWSNYFDTDLIHQDTMRPTQGYITDVLTDKAIEFIGRNRDQPFFCYLPVNVPHSPFQLPDRYFDKYKAKGLSDRNAAVHGMVENLDDNLGRLFTQLEEWGLRENTIVVFITDNGPNGQRFNAGMRGWKSWVYEGGIRVPCFISWPGKIAAGQVLTELTDHVDVLPTLVGLTGITKPEGPALDGINLSALLLDQQDPAFPKRQLFSHMNQGPKLTPYPGAVRNEDYHLVIYDSEKPELYAMAVDPGEQKNLADSLPELTTQLKAAYDNWWMEVSAAGPTDPAIPVGYAAAPQVELPAHEAVLEGSLTYKHNRNGWAHDWIVNWAELSDQAIWEIDVVEAGNYQFTVQYACTEAQKGTELRLGVGEEQGIRATLSVAHVPTVIPSPDRVAGVRTEALEQSWAYQALGELELQTGKYTLSLQALDIPGEEVGEIKGIWVEKR